MIESQGKTRLFACFSSVLPLPATNLKSPMHEMRIYIQKQPLYHRASTTITTTTTVPHLFLQVVHLTPSKLSTSGAGLHATIRVPKSRVPLLCLTVNTDITVESGLAFILVGIGATD